MRIVTRPVSDLLDDISEIIITLVIAVVIYSFLMWYWGGMVLANIVGPLFLWWGMPLPDLTNLRLAMIALPALPFITIWIGTKVDMGNAFNSYFSLWFFLGTLVINLWPIPAVLGGQYWVRNTVYQHLTHEERVEFWHWRSSDFIGVDPEGSGPYMKYINMRLMEIGAEPIGTNPRWDNIKFHKKIIE